MDVRLELRRHLGSAFVYVRGIPKEIEDCHDLSAEATEGGLSIFSSSRVPFLHMSWPIESGLRSKNYEFKVNLHRVSGGQLTIRVQFRSSLAGVENMALSSTPYLTRLSKWPRCMSIDPKSTYAEGSFNLQCRACSTCLTTTERGLMINRVLPLPSLDWKELATDWFCGCGNNSACGGHSEGKDNASESAAANRALSANDPLAVAASTATLLYTPGFIVIPGSWVDEAKVTSRKLGETSIVALRCANCLRELGLQESLKENALRLFDHAIVATLPGHPALPWSAADTVADLMLSALVDSQPTKAPKIVLTGPTSALTVWVLDQSLVVFGGRCELIPNAQPAALTPIHGLQVLWKPGNAGPATVDINVTDELVSAAISSLDGEGQHWWLSKEPGPSGFQVGWLQLPQL